MENINKMCSEECRKWMEYRNNHYGFTREMGMKVTEVSDGYARVEMDIDKRSGNPIGSVHGGVIFALADTAGGVAATTKGSYVTTVTGNINYLNPALTVKRLIATTREVKVGKNILVYDVSVRDENEKIIAEARMTFYSLHKKVVL